MSMKKSSKKLHGSVLFTVIVVMVVLLIVVLTAIGLAGAASRRAYSTWFDNQTKYTAQDLVDNVIETFGPGNTNETLGQSIINQLGSKGDSVSVTVSVDSDGDGTDDGSYIPGYGRVNSLTFTYVANNGSDYNLGIAGHDNEQIIKVTAEVEMSGEVSTYSRYVVGTALTNRTNGNGGGFVSYSEYKNGDQPRTIGRNYLGIEQQIATLGSGNETFTGGDIFLNVANYTLRSQGADSRITLGRNDPENGYYGGMRITGNVDVQGGYVIDAQYPPSYITDLSKEKFYNAPYVYVDGILTFNSANGFNTLGNGMVNLYCNQLQSSGNTNLEGNVNIMTLGEGLDNNIAINTSKLTDWASATISGVTNKGIMESGNFYCKGNLNKSGNGMEVNGDLCVVGDLYLSGDITVNNGNVYVGGKVYNVTYKWDGVAGKNVIDQKTEITVPDDGVIGQIKGGAKVGLVNASGSADFVTKLKNLDSTKYPDAKNAAARFETAYTLKAPGAKGVSYVQTIENIKGQFVDETDPTKKKYVGVVETSNYTLSEQWDGNKITKSCVWDSTHNPAGKTVEIDPGASELWINIDPSLTSIEGATIIVDDSKGGKVKFFIEKNGASQTLSLNQSKFITKTYKDLIDNNTDIKLQTYPVASMVPQIYMYASTDTNVKITMQNGGNIFTGDIIAPGAEFVSKADNGIKRNVEYTYFNYIDLDKNGSVDVATEKANAITTKRNNMNLCFIGSLQVGNIDVTNEFGYLYVDDPPYNGTPPAIAGGYSWTTLDGYSNY